MSSSAVQETFIYSYSCHWLFTSLFVGKDDGWKLVGPCAFLFLAEQAQFTRLDGRTLHSSNACMLFFRYLQKNMLKEHYFPRAFWENCTSSEWYRKNFSHFWCGHKKYDWCGWDSLRPVKRQKDEKGGNMLKDPTVPICSLYPPVFSFSFPPNPFFSLFVVIL